MKRVRGWQGTHEFMELLNLKKYLAYLWKGSFGEDDEETCFAYMLPNGELIRLSKAEVIPAIKRKAPTRNQGQGTHFIGFISHLQAPGMQERIK